MRTHDSFSNPPVCNFSFSFFAQRQFEATLAPLWQAFKLVSRMSGEQHYKKGDGSDYEKLNNLYNISKHFYPADLAENRLHQIWITNDGLAAEGYLLSLLSRNR